MKVCEEKTTDIEASLLKIFAEISVGVDKNGGIYVKAADIIEPVRKAHDRIVLLRKNLEEFVEMHPDRCSYDHHGYCQEHGWTEKNCPVAIAKELIK